MKVFSMFIWKIQKNVEIAWRKMELIVQATSFESVHEQIKDDHTHKKRKMTEKKIKTNWREEEIINNKMKIE